MNFYDDFASAVLDPECEVPKGILAMGDRFDVYRNNVTASLSGALARTFPVLRHMLGKEYFNALAVAFVRLHPPKVRVVTEYGADFPDFIEGFDHLREFAYLGDVARLEWARLAALHAANAFPVDPALAEDPQALLDTRLQFHPSATLVCSAFPIADLWATHQLEDVVSPSAWTGQNVLIFRFEDRILDRVVSSHEAKFLELLPSKRTLGDALFALGDEQLAAGQMVLCLNLVRSECLIPDHP